MHLDRIEGLSFELSLAGQQINIAPESSPQAVQQALEAILNNGFDPRASRVLLPLFDLPAGSPAPHVIQAALEYLPGVIRSSVHVPDEAVEVWYVPGEVGIAEIRERIRQTGQRTDTPASDSELDVRLNVSHRRARWEAIASLIAAIIITLISIPLAGDQTPTVAEPIASAAGAFVRSIAPVLYEIDPTGLEVGILLITFAFLIWLGRSWMESGSFTLMKRTPDSNTTAAAAVFVLAAGITIASIRVAWKEDLSYAFPGYATLFWMIALYSLARLFESRELGRIRRLDSASGISSAPGDTDVYRRAQTTMSLALRIVICIAVASFVLWFDLAGESSLLYAVIAFAGVMIVTVPALFGFAVPAALSTGMQEAARRGVVIRDAGAFESLGNLRSLAVLKEGILTEGRPVTSDYVLLGGIQQRDLLETVGSLARLADSDLARAVIARVGSFAPSEVTEFRESPGLGFSGKVSGRKVTAGTARFVASAGFELEPVNEELARYGGEGKNTIVVTIDGKVAGVIAMRDEPLAGAADAVARLQGLGVDVHLFGSDDSSTLEAIGAAAGVRTVTAEVDPDRLRGVIAEAGTTMKPMAVLSATTANGLLLTVSDLPIAFTDDKSRAVDLARVILPGRGLDSLADAIVISRAASNTASRNIHRAVGYHVVAVLIATQILRPLTGAAISPAILALVMLSALMTAVWSSRRFEKQARAL